MQGVYQALNLQVSQTSTGEFSCVGGPGAVAWDSGFAVEGRGPTRWSARCDFVARLLWLAVNDQDHPALEALRCLAEDTTALNAGELGFRREGGDVAETAAELALEQAPETCPADQPRGGWLGGKRWEWDS